MVKILQIGDTLHLRGSLYALSEDSACAHEGMARGIEQCWPFNAVHMDTWIRGPVLLDGVIYQIYFCRSTGLLMYPLEMWDICYRKLSVLYRQSEIYFLDILCNPHHQKKTSAFCAEHIEA